MVVFDGRIYMYCSHDLDNSTWYDMVDYTVISSDDLVNWTDHGEVFRVKDHAPWATKAYAPACIERNGKYYLYFPDGDKGIGVVVGDTPLGPFKDPLGKPLINRSTPNSNVQWCFDPAVFIDDDGQAYCYFGGGDQGYNARVIKLNEDMISVSGQAEIIHAPGYIEAPFMHKHKGTYYYSYSARRNGGDVIEYMISDDPMKNFQYKGAIFYNPPDNLNNNNHASMVEYKGKWYFAYHNRKISGAHYERSVNIDLMSYNDDGTIEQITPTWESVPQLKHLDPNARIEAEAMDEQFGIETAFCLEGGCLVDSIDNEDWIRYTGFNFNKEFKKFKARVSSGTKGGSIEIHVDSLKGTLIGTCSVPYSNIEESWSDVECSIKNISGIRDIYLKFIGTSSNLFSLNWFTFGEGTSIKEHKPFSDVYNRGPQMHHAPPFLHVDFNDRERKPINLQLAIHDLKGRELYRTTKQYKNRLSFPIHFASGTYLITIRYNTKVFSKVMLLKN